MLLLPHYQNGYAPNCSSDFLLSDMLLMGLYLGSLYESFHLAALAISQILKVLSDCLE